jgi:hypothetical protein
VGIMVPIARMILREHKRKPITGDLLLIGRQSVPLTPEDARTMIRQEGLEPRDVTPAIDTTTGVAEGRNCDAGFFSLFTDVRVRALDVTDYEGAEIIHDMQMPIPETLAQSADFILNGSCLDNMSNAAQAMHNMGKMLRPCGRMFNLEMGTPNYNPYTMFSQSGFSTTSQSTTMLLAASIHASSIPTIFGPDLMKFSRPRPTRPSQTYSPLKRSLGKRS